MFNFRIIAVVNGNQIIDRNLKTPYTALTPMQMLEYIKIDEEFALMDRMERKARKETSKKNELARDILCRLACLSGMI